MIDLSKILASLQALATKALEIIRQTFRQRGKDATGQTLGSLRSAVNFQASGSSVEIELYGSKVFDFIESGRPPGSKMPPQGALLEWMSSKGIPRDKEFVIRRAIGQKGIEPVPIIEVSVIQIQREFNQKVAPEILQRMSGLIFEAVKNGFDLNIAQ